MGIFLVQFKECSVHEGVFCVCQDIDACTQDAHVKVYLCLKRKLLEEMTFNDCVLKILLHKRICVIRDCMQKDKEINRLVLVANEYTDIVLACVHY